MIYSPQNLLDTTESLLKYDEDERLSEASPQHLHNALGRAVMIAVGDNWAKSRARRAGKRKAFYLSAEYLVGRLVYNNLFNLGILDEMRRAFAERGIDLACLIVCGDAGYIDTGQLLFGFHKRLLLQFGWGGGTFRGKLCRLRLNRITLICMITHQYSTYN